MISQSQHSSTEYKSVQLLDSFIPPMKEAKIRHFDNDGYRHRAACICIRNDREDEVLLVTARGKPSWIIPGGGVERDESIDEAAHRELYEEAGVKGRIVRQLGIFANDERKNRTSVFVVHVEEEFDDWDEKRSLGRERYWHKISHAFSLLHLHRPFQLTFLERFICTSPNHHQLLNEIQKEI